jgi:D-glycero-alpha-D-manno-heptose-7-phosphate kinase
VTVSASAPARVDLAGGTLDLWPIHVLHPGTVTVNVAIGLLASCRVRAGGGLFRVRAADRSFEHSAGNPSELLGEPRTALVGSLLEALDVRRPVDVEIATEVPYGSGIGGSSALTVALLGALAGFAGRDLTGVDRVELVRDVETRVLGRPAGVQDYYPALEGGLHSIAFQPGATRARRDEVDPEAWERHLTLFDTGASHSSGMNNWEILRARLEGDARVTDRIEEVRNAAVAMRLACAGRDFEGMGRALAAEWDARRQLAPVVETPLIARAIVAARGAGAWAGKACGAGGGGFVVLLAPAESTAGVRDALASLGAGKVVRVPVVNRGLEVSEAGDAGDADETGRPARRLG